MRTHKSIYQNIRNIREDHDLTQQQIADILGIRQQYYSDYEKGVYDFPIRHLLVLAQFYHCTTDYLLGLTDYKHSLDSLKEPFFQCVTIGSLLSNLTVLTSEKRKLLLDFIDYLLSS